jgi:hypothetical protein
MLREDLHARLTALALVTEVTAPVREQTTRFCGICCVDAEEEEFSGKSEYEYE